MRFWGEKSVRQRLLLAAAGVTFLCAFALSAMLMANGVDTTVSAEDRLVIAELNVDDECEVVDGFDAELRCIGAVQESIFERYPDTSDAFQKGLTDHQIKDYDTRGYGSCYDRAKLIEQTLRYYGFDVRRVAIYRQQSTPFNYLKPGIQSHALSEVETSNGWMAVESVDPLIGVDDRGTAYGIGDIRDGIERGDIDDETFGLEIPDNFFDGEFVYVYGVYSRHGYFFEPHIPVPEVDWKHFGWS